MRRAELVTAVVLAALSIYFMWKSAELEIGWIEDEGPGGGAWPFWLAAIMLACCGWTIVNWIRRTTPASDSDLPFMDGYARKMFLLVGGGVTAMVALVHIVGMYGSLLVFLIYYIRFLGQHSWVTTLTIALITPVATFFLFDIAMTMDLPKGYLEPLFLPLYAIFL